MLYVINFLLRKHLSKTRLKGKIELARDGKSPPCKGGA